MKTSKENVLSLKTYNPGINTAKIILNANENPKNITADYIDEIKDMLVKFEFNRYPDTNSSELRKAYGKYCNQPQERIICGNGSDEIIRLLLEAYVDKKDAVVVHDPTFSMYDITNTVVGGRTVKVKSESNFDVNIDDVIDAAKKEQAKVVFLCNPNNPTGNVFSKKDIIKALKEINAVVAVDEAYIEFGGETVIDLTDTYENLIVLRTLSKAFGLCALRVGFGIGSKEIIETLYKVKAPYNLNQLSQNIAVIALSHIDNMEEQVKKLIKSKDKLMEELGNMEWIKVYGSHANFIYIEADSSKVKSILSDEVSIRYFGENYMRISVGEPEENKRLIELLKKI